MRLCLTLLFSLFLIAGCSDDAAPPTTNAPATNFLALGDSYTIGQSVAPAERWPIQLAAALRADGVDVREPLIIARTGWTCADLAAAMSPALEGQPKSFAMVSLLIGVNDQFRGGAPEPYRKAFADLLARAIQLAGDNPSHVLVLSIPDYGATPFGESDPRGPERIGKEIDAFNTISREESARAGVKYVDITAESREAKNDRSLVADDGLHPSGTMYAKWTALALPAAREVFGKK